MEVRPDGESNLNYEMNKCIGIIQKGGAACCRNVHAECGRYCKTHYRMHQVENPATRLPVVNTPDTDAGIAILNKFREYPTVVQVGMLMLYATRLVYPPKVDANKFIVGGVSEQIMTEMIRNVGFEVENVSATESVIDIRVVVNGRSIEISLKNSGNINSPPILENYRGDKVDAIRCLPPTLIIYTEQNRARIVYIDHAILRKSCEELNDEDFHKAVYKQSDSSLTFVSSFLKTLIPRLPDEYVLSIDVPQVPALAPSNVTQLVMDHIRKELHNAVSDARRNPSRDPSENSIRTTYGGRCNCEGTFCHC
jgi:hypothetical protein